MNAQEQLERIQRVIQEIEIRGYSELQTGGKRFKTHDLPTLYARERELIARVSYEENDYDNTSYVSWERR